jgi:hypothetical protein
MKCKVTILSMQLLVLTGALAGGCASSNEPSMRERQDAAMRDPFSYGSDSKPRSVSGGSTSEFDRDAFKRDMNRVLNP